MAVAIWKRKKSLINQYLIKLRYKKCDVIFVLPFYLQIKITLIHCQIFLHFVTQTIRDGN